MSSSQKSLFVAFWSSYDDDAYGEDVPLGCVIRLGEAAIHRMNAWADRLQSGEMVSATVALDHDSIRWIKKVGYLSDNSVAPIEGFMTGDDRLIASDAFLNAEIDVEADFQDACDVYTNNVTEEGFLFSLVNGAVLVAPSGRVEAGQRSYFSFPGIYMKWEEIRSQATEFFAQADAPAAEPTPSLSMDATDKATILAALSHYLAEGQGEPCNRSDEIHQIAVADDEVISMDDQGIKDLIARVRSVVPQTPSSEVLPGADDARKYFESTILVKVLTEDGPVGNLSLGELAELVDTGPGVGGYMDLSARQISPQTAARRLREMGSEPGFFRLDDNGVHEDDIDEDGPAVQRPSA